MERMRENTLKKSDNFAWGLNIAHLLHIGTSEKYFTITYRHLKLCVAGTDQ